jgi:long-chain acyl-CoA synthetase
VRTQEAEATAAVFAREGWVRTGDVGALDEDEFVKLKGRREDLFRLQGGELVCPWKAEKLLKASPLIEDALVLGDSRGHVAALLILSSLSRALSQQDRMAGTHTTTHTTHTHTTHTTQHTNQTLTLFRVRTALKEAVTSANGKLEEAFMIKKIATISPSTKLAHNPQCTTPLGRYERFPSRRMLCVAKAVTHACARPHTTGWCAGH